MSSLLDTSVLIALDERGSLDLPEAAAISVISLGELRAGVEIAEGSALRAARERRLSGVYSAFVPIAVDQRIADSYGHVLARARSSRRSVKATDLLIIATARVTGRTLVTLDEGQANLARDVGQSARVP